VEYATPQLIHVEPLPEHDTRHQHRNRDGRTALDASDTFGLALTALEAGERPVVLPDVLDHQHHIPPAALVCG